jgi:hypothetical protein
LIESIRKPQETGSRTSARRASMPQHPRQLMLLGLVAIAIAQAIHANGEDGFVPPAVPTITTTELPTLPDRGWFPSNLIWLSEWAKATGPLGAVAYSVFLAVAIVVGAPCTVLEIIPGKKTAVTYCVDPTSLLLGFWDVMVDAPPSYPSHDERVVVVGIYSPDCLAMQSWSLLTQTHQTLPHTHTHTHTHTQFGCYRTPYQLSRGRNRVALRLACWIHGRNDRQVRR